MESIDVLNEIIQKELKKKEDIKKILSNKDYIEWVKNFMRGKETVYAYEFEEDEYFKKDLENIDMIPSFFQVIENYAKDNFLYPTDTEFGYYFSIKYQYKGYDVGVIAGQGVDYYIAKSHEKDIDNFIDFERILNNEKQDNYINITTRLENIKREIINSYEDDVPLEAIEDMVDNVVKTLKKKRK